MEQTDVLDSGYVRLLDVMGNDMRIVNSARVSFLGESKGEEADKKLLFYLMKNEHMSPFEMVEFLFEIKCPLFVRSQIVRHRTASMNEVSRRYTSEELEFYLPKEFRKQSDSNKQGSTDETTNPRLWNEWTATENVEWLTSKALEIYEEMVNSGIAREQARMILPQNLYTKFFWKTDLRNLLHFLDLRTSTHAQWETRQYALAMQSMIEPHVPWTLEAWNLKRKVW